MDVQTDFERFLPIFYEQLGNDKDTPEHKLLVAIIIRSMLDYISKDVSLKQARKSADRFFDEEYENEEPFSFWWCCHHLVEDEKRLMRHIRILIQKAKKDPSLFQVRVAI